MKKNNFEIHFIGILGAIVMILYIMSGLLPNNDIESTLYNYKCIYCQKVTVENKLNSKLNCLNNKNIDNINLGYNVYDNQYQDFGDLPNLNKAFMFINYTNSLGKKERISVTTIVDGNKFLWDNRTVAKIFFNKTQINLVTSKKSLMMDKKYYLNTINELAGITCGMIEISESNIIKAKKDEQNKIKNFNSWKSKEI